MCYMTSQLQPRLPYQVAERQLLGHRGVQCACVRSHCLLHGRQDRVVPRFGFRGQRAALAGVACEVKEQRGVVACDVFAEAEADVRGEAAVGARVEVWREVEDFPEGRACREHA